MSKDEEIAITRENFINFWLDCSIDQRYKKFRSYTVREKKGMRAKIIQCLNEIVFIYHHDIGSLFKDLKDEHFPVTFDCLERRPSVKEVRLGNFGEILAAEILKDQKKLLIPFLRFRYFLNPEASSPGYDVIAFKFQDDGKVGKDLIFYAESKVRTKFQSLPIKQAYQKFRGKHPRPGILSFIRSQLRKEGGNEDLVKKLLRLESSSYSQGPPINNFAIFNITGNIPRDPFECVEKKRVNQIIPRLETFHFVISDLNYLVKNVFESDVDIDGL